MDNTENFKRKLRNLEGMLQRRDSGKLDGRNDAASTAHLRYSLKALWALVNDDDSVAAMLDTNDRLSARFNRAERRVHNLPV